jgi:hypothetical protein
MATTTARLSSANALVTDNGGAWVNPANAYATNGSTADSSLSASDGDVHAWTDFGFDVEIDAGATINGLTLVSNGTADFNRLDITYQVYSGGAQVGTAKVIRHYEVYQSPTLGGASDMWGTTLTAADVRSSGFGFTIQKTPDRFSRMLLDSFTVVIDYTPGAGGSDTEVNASTDALTLTENTASIALDVDVSASTAALTVTGQQATIALDTEISAGTDTLTLSQHPATVSLDTSIQAATDSLTLTEYPATIEVGGATIVNANTAALFLADYRASIGHDVNVGAGTDTLAISTFAASITNPSSDTNVLAGASALTIGTYTVTITGVVPVTLPAPSSTPASRTAQVAPEARMARAAYENRTVTVPRKQQPAA